MQPDTAVTPTLIASYGNHFDLIWRRGWKRGYEHLGLYYRSYADLEEAIITRWLKLAMEQGTSFTLEQAYSLREYLSRHPDTLPIFQQLEREGRFYLHGAGEAIIDVNMCDGETMARNFASGVRYVRELFGRPSLFAYHCDGFGSSAQFPQVARRCGLPGIEALSYCYPDASYWRGVDGSTVFVGFHAQGGGGFYDHCYYEPCLACKGYGTVAAGECTACEGTGLRLCQGVYPPRKWATQITESLGHYNITSEEMFPDAQLPAAMIARNAEGQEQYRWGTPRDLLSLCEEALARVDDADVPLSSRMENNPTQTGTLVTRIRLKQAARQAEGWYYAAEKLATLAPPQADRFTEELSDVWLKLPLLFFHDAINGTHNDPAHQELLDVAAEVVQASTRIAAAAAGEVLPGATPITTWVGEGSIAVFNPHGFPASLPVELPATGDGYAVTDADDRAMPVYREPAHRELSAGAFAPVGPDYWIKRGEEPPSTLRFLATELPPLGMKVFHVRSRAAAVESDLHDSVEHAGYRLGWDAHGVRSIIELASGEELLNADAGPAGQLILEGDLGDPWGTRNLERPRTYCGEMTRLLGAHRRGDAVEVSYHGKLDNGTFGREKDPCVFGLEWYLTARLLSGLPWVEFELEVYWQAADKRLRVAFPSRATTDRGQYKIPYGVLTRERYEMTETCLWSPNGDWPATNFMASEPHGDVPGLAVFNTGTPSARIEDGVLLYSIVRAPGFGHCLQRYAQEYPMPTAEMRDGGHHQFRFALMPATRDNLPQLLQAGYQLNQPAPSFRVPAAARGWESGLAVAEPGAFITAVKPRFAGGGLAVRLVEQLGLARDVTLSLPAGITSARLANLLEDPGEQLQIIDQQVQIPMTPYAINTVVLA